MDVSFQRKRQIISSLNRLDLRSADYGEIRKLVNDLMAGVVFEWRILVSGQRLYRARVSSDRPGTIADLANPPDHLVVDFQRCNPPNRATFYCASCSQSAIREIGVQVGDVVYVSEWIVSEEFLAASIAPKSEFAERNAITGMIETFFETKFTHPVHEVFSTQYKITSAIFDELTSVIPSPVEPKKVDRAVLDLGFKSLIYPSTANRNESDCVAIAPDFAKRILRIEYVEERRVTRILDRSIEYDIKRGSYVFHDREIQWSPDGQILCRGDQSESDVLATLESRRSASR